ncbi:acyclic terpene utilization AtuA family protein [Reyranella sp. CPCC 100927]|uniref:acyclic terpene utilization AtuA family protein n=1 Tax=Reyranella sp. CPCC 100927 TaxID=2599616 RepID=UPI001C498072|nr:acyclic terpene utilization AtuA family protein [Reyranella sp. CPCC 100927]
MAKKTVRIGGSSGFWGDTETAAIQLVRHGNIDYLVSDYLAEVTMSIMAAQKMRNPQAGYATDFATAVIAPLAREIADKKIKVITNAGGVNPQACRDAVLKACEQAGVTLKVALVLGDELMPQAQTFRDAGVTEMDGTAPLPAKITSMNAYLGGFPIARALAEGADVVITGRCVDSAVTLGPLIYAFGWTMEDFDRLAAGTLAGHILECGAQCNGGNFTDWRLVPDYDNMGFPIAEVSEDGSFVLSKPDGTGGLITTATVAEQMLYEIGDPRAYMVPDVACDFTNARYEQVGKDKVRISGVKGRPPTDSYKVSTTWPDGYKFASVFMLSGIDAVAKGRHSAEMIVKKTRRMFREKNLGDYREVSIEVIGGEDTYGPHSRAIDAREVVVKIAARHDQKEALSLLGREIAPMATGGVVGMSGSFGAGRVAPSPVIRMFSCLVPKAMVPVTVDIDGRSIAVEPAAPAGGFHAGLLPTEAPAAPKLPSAGPNAASETVPLVALAYGRSGDKGDNANIGIFARKPAYAAILDAEVTEEAVAQWFAHRIKGKVTRWRLPGIGGFNFLLREALGGGGMASIKADPLAKAFAQMLLDMPVRVPASVAAEVKVA